MGLDIFIQANNDEQLYSKDHSNEKNIYSRKNRLSRTFCNFICRQNVVEHKPELDQIGDITGVDIHPIYEMESYPDNEGLSFFLEYAENEDEKKAILEKAEKDKANLQDNIDKVLNTVSALIDKLSSIENIPELLLPTEFDTLESDKYFADFKLDTGQRYVYNNFGQDLRNFKYFLEFAKANGTTTVWFYYG